MWGAASLGLFIFVSPVTCTLTGVHFWEKKSENSLSILPVKVTELDCNLLLLARELILLLHIHQPISELFLHALILALLVLSIPLGLQFSSLFFLHLLECLQEKLLNIRPLIKDHLRQGFQIDAFFHFESTRFSQTFELLILLLDDLLVLKLYQFSFFFKILNDLAERWL